MRASRADRGRDAHLQPIGLHHGRVHRPCDVTASCFDNLSDAPEQFLLLAVSQPLVGLAGRSRLALTPGAGVLRGRLAQARRCRFYRRVPGSSEWRGRGGLGQLLRSVFDRGGLSSDSQARGVLRPDLYRPWRCTCRGICGVRGEMPRPRTAR
jgi:hypothetical protein